MQKNRTRSSKGFTIIEVLIVLAIAGLMMVVVFLAVPALQRSGRNNAANTNANNILTGIGTFTSNNGGTLPTTFTADPTNGKVAISSTVAGSNPETVKVDTSLTAATWSTGAIPGTKPAPGQYFAIKSTVCNDLGTMPVATTNGRSYTVWFGIESGGGNIAKCIGS